MKSYIGKISNIIVLATCLFAGISQQAMAQALKRVGGYVYDKDIYDREGRKVPFSTDVEITVVAFNTVASAEDWKSKMEKDPSYNGTVDDYDIPDQSGYYEVLVSETGALVFYTAGSAPVLEKVNFRKEINVFIDQGLVLDNVNVTANRIAIGAIEPEAERYGNTLAYRGGINLPRRNGKTGARMVIKPFVVNHSRKDTLCNRIPRVYEGKEFGKTQARWRGFKAGNDTLSQYVMKDIPFDDEAHIYVWNDTVILPNANESFQAFAEVTIEDYLGVYYHATQALSPKNPRRPLKMLEYSLKETSMDPMKYKEEPKSETHIGVENVSLNFLIGKAELDPDDPNNAKELERLRGKLMSVVNDESSTLKKLHISSVSSPDGSYASNLALAQKRLKYAEQLILSMLPKYTRDRLYMYNADAARVAEWEEVAQLLEADSLVVEAQAIRDVVKKYPKSRDLQAMNIKKLPSYDAIIVEYLPKLRSMTCEYEAEVYRALTPEEIMYRYENDADYREGRKQFALYEYWNLFNMVKDPKELEVLYKRAYDYSRTLSRDGKPWALAANNLAVSYLKRDTVDTSILEPLIDRTTANCNVERRMNGRLVEVVNIEEIVANQLLMYLRVEDYDNASIMAQILQNLPKYETLWAFAYCLKGYYKYSTADNLTQAEKEKRDKVFNLVRNSSPLNNVVMCLAMKNARYNQMAEMAVKELPQNDAKTQYLWTIIYLRKGDAYYLNAQMALLDCFRRDPSYIEYAKTDGDINEEFLEETLEVYNQETSY